MNQTNFSYSATKTVSYDQGLRSYMLSVYNYMAIALAVTGLVAFFVSSNSSIMSLFFNSTGMTGLGTIVTFAPLGIALAFGFSLNKMKLATVQLLYWTYASLLGISLSSLFLVYTGESLARVFFITSSLFGVMSLYGYTTKKDLTGFGSLLIMALFGVIIAQIVNIFLSSNGLTNVLSFVVVLLFTGLTAYDTQKIKNFYYQSTMLDSETSAKYSIMAALTLYLDFVNLFVHILRFLGQRRGD